MNAETITIVAALTSIISMGVAALTLYMHTKVGRDLAEFKNVFLETLNGRYIRRRESELQFDNIDRRFDHLEETHRRQDTELDNIWKEVNKKRDKGGS